MIAATLEPFWSRFLRGTGHQVDGLDVGLYEGCDIGAAPESIGTRSARDIKGAEASQLVGYDAVICLATLSNDPLGQLNPAATYSINYGRALRVTDRCLIVNKPSLVVSRVGRRGSSELRRPFSRPTQLVSKLLRLTDENLSST